MQSKSSFISVGGPSKVSGQVVAGDYSKSGALVGHFSSFHKAETSNRGALVLDNSSQLIRDLSGPDDIRLAILTLLSGIIAGRTCDLFQDGKRQGGTTKDWSGT